MDEIYQDKLNKLISEDLFIRNLNRINADVDLKQERVAEIDKELNALDLVGGTRVELLSKYEHIDELTHEIVDLFVKSIYISKRIDNEREIKIVWNF